MYVCAHANMYIYMCACVYIRVYAYMRSMHKCILSYIYSYIHNTYIVTLYVRGWVVVQDVIVRA